MWLRWWVSSAALLVALSDVYAAGAPAADMPGLSLIPTDISNACYTLLEQVNEDTVFSRCTEPLIAAAEQFTNSSTSGQLKDSLKSSLDALCNQTSTCDRPLVRQYIGQFWDACMDELEGGHKQVRELYDYMYMFTPFRDAVCSRDADDAYCLQTLAPTTGAKSRLATARLHAAAPGTPSGARANEYWEHVLKTIPNASTVVDDMAPQQVFLFLSDTTETQTMCSTCAKKVLAAYIAFELSTPYALGLESSEVLRTQPRLYAHALRTCGLDFVRSVNELAGVQAYTAAVGAASAVRPTLAALVAAVAVSIVVGR